MFKRLLSPKSSPGSTSQSRTKVDEIIEKIQKASRVLDSKEMQARVRADYRNDPEKLEQIFDLFYDNPRLSITTDKEKKQKQQEMLQKELRYGAHLSFEIIINGSQLKLDLTKPFHEQKGLLESSQTPLQTLAGQNSWASSNCKKKLACLLKAFKKQYESHGSFKLGETTITHPNDYLTINGKSYYADALSVLGLSKPSSPIAYQDIATIIDCFPKDYIAQTTLPKTGTLMKDYQDDLFLYEYIFCHCPSGLRQLLDDDAKKGADQHKKLDPIALKNLLFFIIKNRSTDVRNQSVGADIVESIVKQLTYGAINECDKPDKSGMTPLQLALASADINPIIIKTLLKKLTPSQAITSTRKGENIFHLCLKEVTERKLSGELQSRNKENQFSAVAQLVMRVKDTSKLLDDKAIQLAEETGHPQTAILCKLHAKGINLHQMVNSIVDQEIKRLTGQRDFTLFGPSKIDKLRHVKIQIKHPADFYEQFFSYNEFKQYSPTMNTAELLAYTLKNLCQVKLHSKTMAFSIEEAFKAARNFVCFSKTDATKNLEKAFNDVIQQHENEESAGIRKTAQRFTL